LARLVKVAGSRWKIEDGFAAEEDQARVGRDQPAGCFAHELLVVGDVQKIAGLDRVFVALAAAFGAAVVPSAVGKTYRL